MISRPPNTRDVTVELISAEALSKMVQNQEKPRDSFSFRKGKKLTFQYFDEQKLSSLSERIQQRIQSKSFDQLHPKVTTQFRIYLFNPFLFKLASYQRMIEYYYPKEDIINAATAQQKHLYKLIDNKKYDDFVVEMFPGKLLQKTDVLGQVLNKSSHLIIQYYSKDLWVFPEQPRFSVVKRCQYCRLIGQMYLRFECKLCQSSDLFCSRVCHFQSLLNHPCEEAQLQLKAIYGSQYQCTPDKDSSLTQKQSAGESQDIPTSESLKNNSDDIINLNLIRQSDISKSASLVVLQRSVSKSNNNINPSIKGRGGIQNIGNSCYMNSSIQLISRTALGQKIGNIKRFGKEQKIVKAYAQLLAQLKEATPSKPVLWEKAQKFKDYIDGHIKDFLGYNQHDAHEFLTVFLDRINEQTKKIYKGDFPIQTKCDSEIQLKACRQWFTHLRHNNSIITRLFYGQQLQETKCPYCNHKKVTFAPFNCISCSIPASHQTVDYQIFHQSYNWRTKITVYKIAVSGKVAELKQLIKNRMNISSQVRNNIRLFVTGFNAHLKECTASENIDDIISEKRDQQQQRKLFVFQCPYSDARVLTFKFIDSKKIKAFTFKRPFFFPVASPLTHQDLYNSVKQYLLHIFAYSQPVRYDTIKNEIQKDIEKYFTLTFYSEGKVDKNNFVIFSGQGKVLRNDFSNIQSPQSGSINEVWVCINNQQGLQNIFFEGVLNKINKCTQQSLTSFNTDTNLMSKSISLIDCLRQQYNKETVLDQGNEWFCQNCQQKRRAYQKTGLYKTGQYLLIQLKRFRGGGKDGAIFQKNKTKIELPLELNLQGLLQNPTLPEKYYSTMKVQERDRYYLSDVDQSSSYLYKLQGIILHTGSIKQGHYKVLCMLEQEWWQFEDGKAKRIDILKRLSFSDLQQKVYIMLYKKLLK